MSLQQTMVVPLPAFQQLLGVTADDVSWLVTATLLTSAVATPIVAKLADMFGKRLMMLVCIMLMTAGSIVAALGGDFATMVAGRSLQGFSSALIPVGISIMRDELPREKVSSAIALMSATLGIGGALGLPLGGILYQQAGWAAVFWLSAAVGVAILAAVLAVVSESDVMTRGRFDFLGAVMLSVILTALLLAISKGGTWGWGSERTILLFVLTVVGLALWIPYSLRVSQPLVDLRTSARRPVLLTNIASVLVGFALFANMLLSTQQLQLPVASGHGFGLDPVVAGLAMIPSGLAMVVFSPVSGAMINRYGGKATLIAGSAIMAAGYIGRVFVSDSVAAIIVGSTVVSVGSAVAYAAMPSLIMANVPITETASANGLNALLRAIGTSSSSAAVAAVLAGVTVTVGGVEYPALAAFQNVFWLAALGSLAACAVVWFVPRFQHEPAPEGVPADTAALAVTQAGNSAESVVHGKVLHSGGQPIAHAVVTVMKTSGEPVDWSRANNDGEFSLALPGPDEYLVVANADGWMPTSKVVRFTGTERDARIRLTQRLTVTGWVLRGGTALPGALIALSSHTGEYIASTRTNDAGSYELRLPPVGRYVVTVVEPDTQFTQSRKLVLTAESTVVNFDLVGASRETLL
ncbi:major facilitator superfamily protein [Arthrobacter crystallopoietes BAB-32]|uniref:Major facilitator superfamily protein n=1 Tax=Arthrobacter crystallopoietes BAB-32 TaxID=1246476 RepID=N1V903_9MICC|nr:major facilitator superfamily protein [Arthrobacter crystallopoietes BAB-32]